MSKEKGTPRRHRQGLLVAVAAGAVLVGALFWFLRRTIPESYRRANIVLVTADTLRADHLPAYGYKRVRTPHLDAMAAESVLFENASTVVPLTLPSHASMFTGTFPMYHGVRDNGGYYLDEKHKTLAETLRDDGYQTGGFVAAFVLDARWGLSQGFDRYYDEFDFQKFERIALDTVQRTGGEVLEEALGWMDDVKDAPFFSWLHFYDVHTPWEAPEPFFSQYQGHRGSRYDAEIAYLDSLMGELFDWLRNERARGRYDRRLHRRSRREPRPTQREHARLFHLRRHDAGAVHPQDSIPSTRRRPPRRSSLRST